MEEGGGGGGGGGGGKVCCELFVVSASETDIDASAKVKWSVR